MGLFDFRKKDRVIDFSEMYKKQKQKSVEMQDNLESNSQEAQPQAEEKSAAPLFPFFDSSQKSVEKPEVIDVENIEDRKKKLAKRLMGITSKLEEISNQLYHLTQRVEVLEKKSKTTNFE